MQWINPACLFSNEFIPKTRIPDNHQSINQLQTSFSLLEMTSNFYIKLVSINGGNTIKYSPLNSCSPRLILETSLICKVQWASEHCPLLSNVLVLSEVSSPCWPWFSFSKTVSTSYNCCETRRANVWGTLRKYASVYKLRGSATLWRSQCCGWRCWLSQWAVDTQSNLRAVLIYWLGDGN